MKNKIFFGIASFLLLITICISPTFGKFVHSSFGVAGFFTFTDLIPTGVFVVTDKNFVNDNGTPDDPSDDVEKNEAQSDSKWGTGGENVTNPEDKYGLGSLENVMFSVSNNSSKKLKVSFYCEIFYSGGFDWGLTMTNTDFNIKITTISKNDIEVNTSVSSANYSYSNTTDKEKREDGSVYKKTFSPIDNIPVEFKIDSENTGNYLIEDLFILETSEYADYNVNISAKSDWIAGIGDLFTNNYYYNFKLVVTEYNP